MMHKEVNEIRSKQLNNPWPKFLKSLSITGLRGWNGQELRFEFPVVVISGENGSGKSTILKAAAAAYTNPTNRNLSYYPGTFFPDTAWETFSDASISYKVREGNSEKNYTYRKPKERWRVPSSRPKREVIFQDVSRTLPIEATVGYAKIAQKSATEVSADTLSEELTRFYSSILGRQYDEARWATSNVDSRRKIGVVKASGAQFSQFHQGAGEDATFDLISLLQNVKNTGLVLIDEVEASLHPRSQRRLIHFLLWLARTRSIQVIMTTHSHYVMEELPIESRIFLSRGSGGIEVLYGVSPDYALNRMDDIERPDLYLFTEDAEAGELVKELLRFSSIDVSRIKFMEAGSCEVIKVLGRLSNSSSLPVNSYGVLDADQAESDGCVRLPGTMAPEKQVFADILTSGVDFLAQRLELSNSSVIDALTRARTLTNHHSWISEAAKHLGNQSDSYLWTSMCQVWVRHCVQQVDRELVAKCVTKLLK